ncbi:MAG: DUF3047 domain-containing protein [Candidatus Omnitrophica bacterium]|nr:DUF3047 domain-containing protein [Candidatus Omnitrophota bacterium]
MKRKIRFTLSVIAVLGISAFLISPAFAARTDKWFSFDKKDALAEWDEKIFKGRVLYSVRVEKRGGYLTAYSNNSASGIFYEISFHPKKYPIASWKWKVIKFPDKASGEPATSQWIEKDDYAARFYVIFPSFFFTNTKSLEYVWDKSLPKGTLMSSPYYRNIKIIVAESGEENLGKWVFEKRNIYADFKKAFGREPGSVGAIAIMTDTDNTVSTAEADYDEIKVGYKDGEN